MAGLSVRFPKRKCDEFLPMAHQWPPMALQWLANGTPMAHQRPPSYTLFSTEPAWVLPANSTPVVSHPETAKERMASLAAKDLRSTLETLDMHGPAAHLFSQSVDGADFLTITEKTLIDDVRCTPFVAKKLLKAREQLLQD